MIRLSIIIPVYNCEQYLVKCINSICQDGNEDIEIILVDDGSTDSSGEICENISKNNSHVIVKHQKNHGVSVARNLGIECAQGEYLWFVDADDYIAENALKNVFSILKDNEDIDIICFNHKKMYKDKCVMVNKIKRNEKLDNLQALELALYRKNLTLGVWDKIFRREIVLRTMFTPNIPIGEDQTACIQFFLHAKNVLLIPENYYCYVQRETSVSNAGGSRVADRIEEAYKNYREHARMLLMVTPELKKAVYSRFVFQALTILGWMARSKIDEKKLGYQVTLDMRKMLIGTLLDKKNHLSIKIISILAAVHYKIVIVMYKIYRACTINKRLIK